MSTLNKDDTKLKESSVSTKKIIVKYGPTEKN